jgi:putative acetyltransferase
LVDALRGQTDPQISLAADHPADGVIGHILFTPVEIHSPAQRSTAIALGPMAMAPEHQRTGVGSALVQAGRSACAEAGEFAVVVLGYPDYYRRFGFRPPGISVSTS